MRRLSLLVARAAVSTANGASGSAAAQEQRRRPDYVPNRIDDPNYVRIFDTTLRDGEQSPGATLTSKEKLEIAKQLAKLGVDIIEAGFPVASPDDFDAVRSIAMDVGNAVDADGYVPVICGLSRAVPRFAGPTLHALATSVWQQLAGEGLADLSRRWQAGWCGLCRDVEVAWDAVRLAKRPRVHTFLATSPIHMQHKLRMTPDQVW